MTYIGIRCALWYVWCCLYIFIPIFLLVQLQLRTLFFQNFPNPNPKKRIQYSSVSRVTTLLVGQLRNRSLLPGRCMSVFPCNMPWRHRGGWGYSCTQAQPRNWMVGGWSASRSVRFTPGWRTLILVEGPVGGWLLPGRMKRLLSSAKFRTGSGHHLTSHLPGDGRKAEWVWRHHLL